MDVNAAGVTDLYPNVFTAREWMSAIDALTDKDGGKPGGGNKTALEDGVETRVLEPYPGNLWDILQFFRDNSD
jgi:hypothetical protein